MQPSGSGGGGAAAAAPPSPAAAAAGVKIKQEPGLESAPGVEGAAAWRAAAQHPHEAAREDATLRSFFAGLSADTLRELLRGQDSKGKAIVHRAAAVGDIEQLERLLAVDPRLISLPDAGGRSPLGVAAASLQPEATRLLTAPQYAGVGEERAAAAQAALGQVLENISDGVRPDSGPFGSTVAALLAAGASLEAESCHEGGLGGSTMLLCAALHRRLYGAAEVLLCRGAKAQRPGGGVQPLHALLLGLPQRHVRRAQLEERPIGGAVPAARALIAFGADPGSVCTDAPPYSLHKGCYLTSMRDAPLEMARGLLSGGATLAGAGGGEAWRTVLRVALYAGRLEEDPRRLTSELVSLLLEAPDSGVNDTGHLGVAPLGYLLSEGLTHLLEEAFDGIEGLDMAAAGQLSAPLRSRLLELAGQLLAAGANPNALDAEAAAIGAAVIGGAMEDDASDDEELMTDDEEVAEGGAAAEAAAALQARRQAWCLRRLSNRCSVAGACQAPLRQAVKLHDVQLTRMLLAAGATPDGGPGLSLLYDAAAEFSVLSWMAHFVPAERKAVTLWFLETAEALRDAGAPPYYLPLDSTARWAWRHEGLLEHAAAGDDWSPEDHCLFPASFAAAAQTLLLINGAHGFPSSPAPPASERRIRRRVPAVGWRPAPGVQRAPSGLYLPAGVLQHILALAAEPASAWVAMLDDTAFE